MPAVTHVLPDGSEWAWIVEWARTSESSQAAYDVSEYDNAVYDGASEDLDWQDASGFAFGLSTRGGKDRFLKRFRTGSGRITLDNTNGRWANPGAGFRPGDFVRLSVRVTPVDVSPPVAEPIPDLTTWNDDTSREWTSHGNLVLNTPAVLAVDYRRFYGRVSDLQFKVRGGIDTVKVNLVGLFADWAVIDLEAVAPVGAGEGTQARMNRIFDAAGFDFTTVVEYGVPVNTMQATTLAAPMLQTAQITMDSEGGDFFENPDGTFGIGYQNWLIEAPDSTAAQYTFGMGGIGMLDALPFATISILINDATFAVVGGTNQNAIDAPSIARYGHRTTRRLDLIAEGDPAAQTLATRAVNQLAELRLRVNQLTIDIDDFDAATMGGAIKFGDLIFVTVESVHGWAAAFQSHVVGVSHITTETTWRVVLTVDDAFVDNVDGAFYFESHSTSFSLGGHP